MSITYWCPYCKKWILNETGDFEACLRIHDEGVCTYCIECNEEISAKDFKIKTVHIPLPPIWNDPLYESMELDLMGDVMKKIVENFTEEEIKILTENLGVKNEKN